MTSAANLGAFCRLLATRSWPMPGAGLAAVLGWSVEAAAVIGLAFRWEPGPLQRRAR